MEILASFSHSKSEEVSSSTNENPQQTAGIQQVLDTLQKFHDWWQMYKSVASPPGSSARLALMKKLKNIEIHEQFPSSAVVEAYLTPKVDENKEAFAWGYPDIESLREFAKKSFGWTTSKTNDILMPVIKKLNEKRTQQSIKNYFTIKNALNVRQLEVSKRVQNAIDKMSGNVDDEATPEKKAAAVKAKRVRKTTNGAAKKNKTTTKTVQNSIATEEPIVSSLFPTNASTSAEAKGPTAKRAPKRVNIPNTRQKIPQREKTLEEMKLKKEQAAEILKQSSKAAKKKRKE